MATRARWEHTWRERPVEEANNLNPAFCGELIFRTMSEYRGVRKAPLSFPLSFLVLPIALHKPTRDQLPGNASAAFAGWAAEHATFLVDFPDRVARLAPVTREALLLLLQHRVIRVEDGDLTAGAKPIRASALPEQTTDDADDARRAAALLGRWFARQRQPSLVMQALGVAPRAFNCAASRSTRTTANGAM